MHHDDVRSRAHKKYREQYEVSHSDSRNTSDIELKRTLLNLLFTKACVLLNDFINHTSRSGITHHFKASEQLVFTGINSVNQVPTVPARHLLGKLKPCFVPMP